VLIGLRRRQRRRAAQAPARTVLATVAVEGDDAADEPSPAEAEAARAELLARLEAATSSPGQVATPAGATAVLVKLEPAPAALEDAEDAGAELVGDMDQFQFDSWVRSLTLDQDGGQPSRRGLLGRLGRRSSTS
jgi:hypothetical protein